MIDQTILIQLPILLFSIIIHEVSHGWTAFKCGDDTAYRMGRITLNPIPHIDMVGSIILPSLAILSHAPVIGWAKPVPVNPMLFNNPKRDTLIVSLAGPFSNILLAVAGSIFLRVLHALPSTGMIDKTIFSEVLNYLIVINIILAVFNLLPIPPLDGSRLISFILPRSLAIQYEHIGIWGIAIVFVLMFSGILGSIVFPVVQMLYRILLIGVI